MLHWFFPGVVGVWMGQWSHRTLLEMNLLMFHAVLQVQSVAGAILFKCAFVSPIDDRVEWMTFFELRCCHGAMVCCVASLVLVHQRSSRGLGGFIKKKEQSTRVLPGYDMDDRKNHESYLVIPVILTSTL